MGHGAGDVFALGLDAVGEVAALVGSPHGVDVGEQGKALRVEGEDVDDGCNGLGSDDSGETGSAASGADTGEVDAHGGLLASLDGIGSGHGCIGGLSADHGRNLGERDTADKPKQGEDAEDGEQKRHAVHIAGGGLTVKGEREKRSGLPAALCLEGFDPWGHLSGPPCHDVGKGLKVAGSLGTVEVCDLGLCGAVAVANDKATVVVAEMAVSVAHHTVVCDVGHDGFMLLDDGAVDPKHTRAAEHVGFIPAIGVFVPHLRTDLAGKGANGGLRDLESGSHGFSLVHHRYTMWRCGCQGRERKKINLPYGRRRCCGPDRWSRRWPAGRR